MFEETRAFVLYFTPLLRFKTEEDNKSSQSTFRRKRLLGEAGIVLVKQDFASNNFLRNHDAHKPAVLAAVLHSFCCKFFFFYGEIKLPREARPSMSGASYISVYMSVDGMKD